MDFQVHLYLTGSGKARQTSYFTNMQLKVLVLAMNAAATDISMTGLPNTKRNACRRYQYQQDMHGASFVVDDGTAESKQLHNAKLTLGGLVGKLFLKAIWSVFRAIVDMCDEHEDHEEELAEINNKFTALFGTELQQGVPVSELGAYAKDFLANSIIVAECAGTKTFFSEKRVGRFRFADQDKIDTWIARGLNDLNEVVRKRFCSGSGDYPSDANHRVDFGLQISPGSMEWSLFADLKKAQQYTKNALRENVFDQVNYDQQLKQSNQRVWCKSISALLTVCQSFCFLTLFFWSQHTVGEVYVHRTSDFSGTRPTTSIQMKQMATRRRGQVPMMMESHLMRMGMLMMMMRLLVMMTKTTTWGVTTGMTTGMTMGMTTTISPDEPTSVPVPDVMSRIGTVPDIIRTTGAEQGLETKPDKISAGTIKAKAVVIAKPVTQMKRTRMTHLVTS
jgi:hypothetical protein